VSEDEPIEEDEAERLEHGPRHAQRRPGEAGVEVALDQLDEEIEVLVRDGPPEESLTLVRGVRRLRA
jgi:hypothetical protein